MDKNRDKKRNRKQTKDSIVTKTVSKKTSKHRHNIKKVKTNCKYPQDLDSASANWKRLSETLNKNKDNNNCNKNKTFFRRNKNPKIEKKKSNDIWFDGVDRCLIKSSMADSNDTDSNQRLVKDKSFSGLTNIVGMDCEMVGTGLDASNSMLARVSIVNFFGHCIYDKFVKPMEEVTDYRTAVSGVRPSDLVNAPDFRTVQNEVHEILKDRTIVGHALSNDFKALLMSHPKNKIRDTSQYFRKLLGGRKPSLKNLSQSILGVKVQSGEHDSVEDARAAMRLFTMYRKKWESDLKKNKIKSQNKTQK